MAKQQSRAGVKALIVVASIGCTFGGWAFLSASAPVATDTAATAQPIASVQSAQAEPAALPTLVPIDDAIAASDVAVAQAQAQPAPRALVSVPIARLPVAMSRSSR
jgi:hypothetical protein